MLRRLAHPLYFFLLQSAFRHHTGICKRNLLHFRVEVLLELSCALDSFQAVAASRVSNHVDFFDETFFKLGFDVVFPHKQGVLGHGVAIRDDLAAFDWVSAVVGVQDQQCEVVLICPVAEGEEAAAGKGVVHAHRSSPDSSPDSPSALNQDERLLAVSAVEVTAELVAHKDVGSRQVVVLLLKEFVGGNPFFVEFVFLDKLLLHMLGQAVSQVIVV